VSGSLAVATLSQQWGRTWFSVGVLALAGTLLYAFMGMYTALMLEHIEFERRSSAPVIVSSTQRGINAYGEFLSAGTDALVAQSPNVGRSEVVYWPIVSLQLPPGAAHTSFLRVRPVSVAEGSLSVPYVLDQRTTDLLSIPGALVLTEADARKTGMQLGQTFEFLTVQMRVVALIRGGLGDEDSLISNETLSAIDAARPTPRHQGQPSFILVAPKRGISPASLAAELNRLVMPSGAQAMTREAFVASLEQRLLQNQRFLRDFLVVSIFAGVILVVIVLQSLSAAIAAQKTEFAVFVALGVGAKPVALFVVEQCLWIGLLGSTLAAAGGMLAQIVLSQFGVEVVILPSALWAVSACLMAATLLGGAAALPHAWSMRPSDLLR
jgi:hypothetical protein